MLAAVQPGQWYGMGDIARMIGATRSERGRVHQVLLRRGWVEKVRNPAYRGILSPWQIMAGAEPESSLTVEQDHLRAVPRNPAGNAFDASVSTDEQTINWGQEVWTRLPDDPVENRRAYWERQAFYCNAISGQPFWTDVRIILSWFRQRHCHFDHCGDRCPRPLAWGAKRSLSQHVFRNLRLIGRTRFGPHSLLFDIWLTYVPTPAPRVRRVCQNTEHFLPSTIRAYAACEDERPHLPRFRR